MIGIDNQFVIVQIYARFSIHLVAKADQTPN